MTGLFAWISLTALSYFIIIVFFCKYVIFRLMVELLPLIIAILSWDAMFAGIMRKLRISQNELHCIGRTCLK